MFLLHPDKRVRRIVGEAVCQLIVRRCDGHSCVKGAWETSKGTYQMVSVARYRISRSITPDRIFSSVMPSNARDASDVYP